MAQSYAVELPLQDRDLALTWRRGRRISVSFSRSLIGSSRRAARVLVTAGYASRSNTGGHPAVAGSS